MKTYKKSRTSAFSLIELIVVIAVIAAIAVIVVPNIGSLTSSATDAAADRNIQLARSTYASYVAAGGTDSATTAATAILASGGWSNTVTIGGRAVTFSVPQITSLFGADGKTGTTATTAAELAALITP